MSLLVEIFSSLVFITAPATQEPVTYFATSGNTTLAYSGYSGWVDARTCRNQCVTIPGQPVQLLKGELSFRDMADLRIMVWEVKAQQPQFEPWRYAPKQHLAFDIWFDGSPICFGCYPAK